MVNKELLKRIILEYQGVAAGLRMLPRAVGLADGSGCVFVGLRRVGKSYLMCQLMAQMVEGGQQWKDFLYINFEDERLHGFDVDDFDALMLCYDELFAVRPVLFLDEIQVVTGWERFVRRLADQKYQVFVTGSNAKMLSGDIASTLGGRLMERRVYPFSFREALLAHGVAVDDNLPYSSPALLAREVEDYLAYGGMPDVVLAPKEAKRAVLSNQFNAIFFRDLVTRYGIRGESSLRTMVRKMAESVMQPLSYNRLAHVVSSAGQKIKVETISTYVDCLIETLLVFPMENMAASLGERVSVRKYYFADNGFVQLFVAMPEPHLLENLVACELHKRYGGDVYFYNHNVEVDFVVPSAGIAIQVCYNMADEETFNRETRALVRLAERNEEIRQLFIITMSEDRTITLDGRQIIVRSLARWLLEQSV